MKNINIFKVKEKKTPNSPDYSMSVKDGDRYLTIGGCWLKDGKDGQKYFSCKLSDGYKDVKGFSVTRDTDTKVEDTIPQGDQIPF
jgi:uncharacterized protein (DUF736 family)